MSNILALVVVTKITRVLPTFVNLRAQRLFWSTLTREMSCWQTETTNHNRETPHPPTLLNQRISPSSFGPRPQGYVNAINVQLSLNLTESLCWNLATVTLASLLLRDLLLGGTTWFSIFIGLLLIAVFLFQNTEAY